MHHIYSIAKNTFRETLRDKILYGTLALSIIFFLFTLFLGSVSLGEEVHVIKSIGLGGMYLFSILLTIVLGNTLIHNEIEEKTIFFVLSKPVLHREIIVGKFLGLFAAIALSLTLMGIVYLGVIFLESQTITIGEMLSILLNIFEVGLLIALVLFFSTFTRPVLATFATVTLLYIGHSLSLLTETAQKTGGVVELTARGINYILPNFEKFNIRNDVVYGISITGNEIVLAFLYTVFYAGLLLFLAGIFLRKHDF